MKKHSASRKKKIYNKNSQLMDKKCSARAPLGYGLFTANAQAGFKQFGALARPYSGGD